MPVTDNFRPSSSLFVTQSTRSLIPLPYSTLSSLSQAPHAPSNLSLHRGISLVTSTAPSFTIFDAALAEHSLDVSSPLAPCSGNIQRRSNVGRILLVEMCLAGATGAVRTAPQDWWQPLRGTVSAVEDRNRHYLRGIRLASLSRGRCLIALLIRCDPGC